MVPPHSACASAGTQGSRDAHEERGSTTQPGSVPARATCRGEHSAALRSPFLPAQHCHRGACWQPRDRAPHALSLSVHRQHRQTLPARHLSTTLLCFKAGKPQQRSRPTPPCSKPQASATGHRNKWQKATADRSVLPAEAGCSCSTSSLPCH